jgi:hypothetical protein
MHRVLIWLADIVNTDRIPHKPRIIFQMLCVLMQLADLVEIGIVWSF